MNLSQLYYFRKLAEVQHYTKAAQELYITQPSLSASILSLERDRGIDLFQREGRGVKLTKYGRDFYVHVCKALVELEVGIDNAKENSGTIGGMIAVACIPTLCGDFLPRSINSYMQECNPTVKFNVFNGMTPFHHRKPGLVGTAFRVRDIYGEVICDGCHSHLAALNDFFAAKGRDYSIMISDSLRAKHCPPGGEYELGGHPIEIRDNGLAYLKGTDTIAGSTLHINRGLRLLVEEALVPFDAALNACTINPARCLRVDDHKGRLAAGYDADLVVLEDNYDVCQTYCKGVAML